MNLLLSSECARRFPIRLALYGELFPNDRLRCRRVRAFSDSFIVGNLVNRGNGQPQTLTLSSFPGMVNVIREVARLPNSGTSGKPLSGKGVVLCLARTYDEGSAAL